MKQYLNMNQNSKYKSQQFSDKLNQFIESHKCSVHNKTLNFVCLDSSCQAQGLICSGCLTINGLHRNHDALEIIEFFENYSTEINLSAQTTYLQQINMQIDEIYDQLLKYLTDFHEIISNLIQQYIKNMNIEHSKKQISIFKHNLKGDILHCNFKSLDDLSQCVKQVLMKRQGNEIEKPSQKIKFQAEFYLSMLKGQTNTITCSIEKIRQQIQIILGTDQRRKGRNQNTFINPQLIQNAEHIYFGQTQNQLFQGRGLLYDKINKLAFFGQFQNNYLEKIGEVYTKKGDCYAGQFKNNLKHGFGTYIWPTQKNIFRGEFVDGKRNGKGVFEWADGSKYRGEFKNGEQEGYGILYRENNKVEYEGQWERGLFHGKGTQYFENGEKFEGYFKEDKFNGKGILTKLEEIIRGKWVENELVEIDQIKILKEGE